MTTRTAIFLAQALAVAALAFPAAAQDLAANKAMIAGRYAQMCATQGTQMPGPSGESDLKGNPKLDAYCSCFGAKFADRAIRTLRTPNAPRPPLQQTVAEERAMRTTCRQQLGLPVPNPAK